MTVTYRYTDATSLPFRAERLSVGALDARSPRPIVQAMGTVAEKIVAAIHRTAPSGSSAFGIQRVCNTVEMRTKNKAASNGFGEFAIAPSDV